MQEKNKALIIVDVQNDFCPGGALAVPKGDEVVPVINRLIDLFPMIIFTKDWHPEHHYSFKEQGGIWPKHCVRGTWGAELHYNLKRTNDYLVVEKGTYPDEEAYSGFGGTRLEKVLRERHVGEVYVCGLATDYCVKATALDAQKLGFETFVIIDACRGVNLKKGDVARAVKEMRKVGIKIITSKEV